MRKLLVFLFAVLLAAPAHAAPKDWSDNEWYQYFEAAVTTLAGEAPGHFAKQAGTVAVTPVTDVYAALSASGSAVKPGLTLWLHRKMEEAALATGDNSRL